jgi:hypothetical protein
VLGREIWIDGEGYFSNDPAAGCIHNYPQLTGKKVWLNSIDNSNNSQDLYAYGVDGITIISVKVYAFTPIIYAIDGIMKDRTAKKVVKWLEYIHFPYFVPQYKTGFDLAMDISGMDIPEMLLRQNCIETIMESKRLKKFFPEKNICIAPIRYGDPPISVVL